ncbi:uncharacterized protein LOC135823480 [Sycon ciliatum]|uniref:uncharacterized protein LOC135823480 n=1 Tax=Sycon ciliatum TaxID=27933 RepID=UPI0031F602D3
MTAQLQRHRQPWLLILDNADSWDMLATSSREAWRGLIPVYGSAGHCLLLTTASTLPEWLQRQVAAVLPVEPQSARDAAKLFLHKLSVERDASQDRQKKQQEAAVSTPQEQAKHGSDFLELDPNDMEKVLQLVSPCGYLSGLPLAIELAAAFISQQDGLETGFAEYVEQLTRCPVKLWEAPNMSSSLVPARFVSQVSRSFRSLSTEARQLAMLLANLSPDSINVHLVTEARDILPVAELQAFLACPQRSGEETSRRYAVHRLHLLVHELRRYSLVGFGPATSLSQVPPQRMDPNADDSTATGNHIVHFHRLVQSSIRCIIADEWRHSTRTSSQVPQPVDILCNGHWSLRAALDLLVWTTQRHSRLHNALHTLPHVLALVQVSKQAMSNLSATSAVSGETYSTGAAAAAATSTGDQQDTPPNRSIPPAYIEHYCNQWTALIEDCHHLLRLCHMMHTSRDSEAMLRHAVQMTRTLAENCGNWETRRNVLEMGTRLAKRRCTMVLNAESIAIMVATARFLQNLPRAQHRAAIEAIVVLISVKAAESAGEDRRGHNCLEGDKVFTNILAGWSLFADGWLLPQDSRFSHVHWDNISALMAAVTTIHMNLVTLVLAVVSPRSGQLAAALLNDVLGAICATPSLLCVCHDTLTGGLHGASRPDEKMVVGDRVDVRLFTTSEHVKHASVAAGSQQCVLSAAQCTGLQRELIFSQLRITHNSRQPVGIFRLAVVLCLSALGLMWLCLDRRNPQLDGHATAMVLFERLFALLSLSDEPALQALATLIRILVRCTCLHTRSQRLAFDLKEIVQLD